MGRIKFALAVFSLAFAAVLVRLFFWQVAAKDELAAKAESQYQQVVTISSSRGEILSRDLAALVTNQTAWIVFAEPKKLKDRPEIVGEKIAKILLKNKFGKLSEEDFKLKLEEQITDLTNKLSNQNLVWVAMARKIDNLQKSEIENLNLPGIGFLEDEKRFYPEGTAAAHLLGFVGSDKFGQDVGYFGLEGFYNSQLTPRAGRILATKDAVGNLVLTPATLEVEAIAGKTLITTIDRNVQFVAQEYIREGVEKYGAKVGSVIIADPKTGAIIAAATYPVYSPESIANFSQEDFKNPIVADSFEPGSIFKLVGVAAALEEEVVKPDTVCQKCDEAVKIGGFTIRTWNNKYYPNSTLTDILVHSDNVGMVWLTEKLGLSKFLRYLKRFQLGQVTGIDLQEETTPALRDDSDWKQIDLATASFGQGIAVTQIKMVQIAATIANGGKLLKPFIVQKTKEGEKELEVKPKVLGEVFSEKTAKILTEMMVAAIERGEAHRFAPAGFKIAGKTGTAQIPIAGHYDPSKTIASFVGFAPADDPKFVMLVTYNSPTSSPYGSETAAPTFFAIAKELFAYFGIAPK